MIYVWQWLKAWIPPYLWERTMQSNANTADIVGLQTAASVVEKTLTQANKVKADKTLEAFVDLIDGKHAAGPKGPEHRCGHRS